MGGGGVSQLASRVQPIFFYQEAPRISKETPKMVNEGPEKVVIHAAEAEHTDESEGECSGMGSRGAGGWPSSPNTLRRSAGQRKKKTD